MDDFRLRLSQIGGRTCLYTDNALHINFATRSIISDDQLVARAMPATHGVSFKFHATGLHPASAPRRSVLAFSHINKGGTYRGPCLETECTGGVCRVRFRRRDFAGSILSSSGRRERQPTIAGVKPADRLNTGESPSPVFLFCVKPRRCSALRAHRS